MIKTVRSPVIRRLAGRIALITGASRGIGAAVARRYAAEGAELVLVARSTIGLERVVDTIRADGGQATPMPVDLSSTGQIDRLCAALSERFDRLDILVGNAAMLGVHCPIAHTDSHLWQKVIDLNVTANFHLIRRLDPLLLASPAGRAIFVTSRVARHVLANRGVYAVSKAALEMLVGLYAAEMTDTPVRVNLVDPGRVRTRMRAEAVPDEDPAGNPPPDAVTEVFVRLAESACNENGALVLAQAHPMAQAMTAR